MTSARPPADRPGPIEGCEHITSLCRYCTRCREWWPCDLDYFYRDRTVARGRGLSRWCKACWAEYKAAHPRKRGAAAS